MKVVHRMPLKQRNLDRLVILPMQNARTFAQHVDWTYTRATRPQDIGVQNADRGAAQISRRDALDKSRHIDMRWARRSTRSIETIQAAIGLNHAPAFADRREKSQCSCRPQENQHLHCYAHDATSGP
jgi:hypothetical protein